MKTLTTLLIVSLAASSTLFAAKSKHKLEYPNGIAAICEDTVITIDEVDRQVMPIVPQIQRESLNPQDFQKKVYDVRMAVIDKMIDQVVLLKEFNSRKGAKIPQTFLDAYHAAYLKENFQGDRSRYYEFLKMQGKTDREFRQEQKKLFIVNALKNELNKSSSEISPVKIQKFYKENEKHFFQDEAIHLKQITLAPAKDETTEDTKNRALMVIKDLENRDPDVSLSERFQELAKVHSDDDRKNSGGDWGWINKSDLREELSSTIFHLEKGQLSQPIVLDNYVFIAYIDDKRDAGYQKLDEVRQQIETVIAQELSSQAQAKKLERLKKKAYIRYYI